MRLGVPSFVKHCLMWHRGKNRKYPKITKKDLMLLRLDLQREEQNMLILRHPYLTVEQSRGHMIGLKDPLKKLKEYKSDLEVKFEKFVTLEDRLHHLKHGENWD